jgi:hypothetical protein
MNPAQVAVSFLLQDTDSNQVLTALLTTYLLKTASFYNKMTLKIIHRMEANVFIAKVLTQKKHTGEMFFLCYAS